MFKRLEKEIKKINELKFTEFTEITEITQTNFKIDDVYLHQY